MISSRHMSWRGIWISQSCGQNGTAFGLPYNDGIIEQGRVSDVARLGRALDVNLEAEDISNAFEICLNAEISRARIIDWRPRSLGEQMKIR